MRKTLPILAAGIALSISFFAPATAHADTTHGCGKFTAIGVEQNAYDAGGGQIYFISAEVIPGDTWCNVGIPINGQFEIEDTGPNGTGCMAINNTAGTVSLDPPSACALNNGAGYPWDRWTATSIEYHSNQLWVFHSADPTFSGLCIVEPYSGSPATYTSCDTTSHYQWFSWPNSGL